MILGTAVEQQGGCNWEEAPLLPGMEEASGEKLLDREILAHSSYHPSDSFLCEDLTVTGT